LSKRSEAGQTRRVEQQVEQEERSSKSNKKKETTKRNEAKGRARGVQSNTKQIN